MIKQQLKHKTTLISTFAIIGTLAVPSSALATTFTFETRYQICDSGDPLMDCRLPGPNRVPGKEYSNNFDVNDLQPIPTTDSEQNLAWDGDGGRENTFDYSGSRSGDTAIREVDALAHQSDALFQEVTNDLVWLLFSTDTDNRIFSEDPGTPTGGIWAEPEQIDADMAAIDPDPGLQTGKNPSNMDVDGLEVWGADGPFNDDADRYSLQDDSVIDLINNRRISVFSYNSSVSDISDRSTPSFYSDELAQAIALLTDLNASDTQTLTEQMDVDALMISGEEIMWSIDPILGFDGGEIFTWNRSQGGSGQYLFHGGHLWDTAFSVQQTFDTASENINALEAVAIQLDNPNGLPIEIPDASGGNIGPDPINGAVDCPPCGQGKKVPEHHSTLSLLALTTLGASSTLLRKKHKAHH